MLIMKGNFIPTGRAGDFHLTWEFNLKILHSCWAWWSMPQSQHLAEAETQALIYEAAYLRPWVSSRGWFVTRKPKSKSWALALFTMPGCPQAPFPFTCKPHLKPNSLSPPWWQVWVQVLPGIFEIVSLTLILAPLHLCISDYKKKKKKHKHITNTTDIFSPINYITVT